MSEEIRTPGGRVLRLETTFENGDHEYGIPGRDEGVFLGYDATEDDVDDAMRQFDARADETVAALLPPGAIIVSEERVRELAVLLVREIGRDLAGAPDSEDARPAIDRLVSALRAGAKP